VRELIDEKLEGRLAPAEPERKPAQVINLMDALKRSLAAEEKGEDASPRRAASRATAEPEKPTKAASRGRKAAAGSSTQRNLLLPVDGGRAKADKADKAAARAEPAGRSRKRA
jgi:DNA end-binding protein Ku